MTFAGLGSARVYAYWFQRRAETISSGGAIKQCAYALEKFAIAGRARQHASRVRYSDTGRYAPKFDKSA